MNFTKAMHALMLGLLLVGMMGCGNPSDTHFNEVETPLVGADRIESSRGAAEAKGFNFIGKSRIDRDCRSDLSAAP